MEVMPWLWEKRTYSFSFHHWVTEHFLSLPSTVTGASTLHSFRQAVKTHLLTASFPPLSAF